jgi:exodeoxyribonuclease VII small subunit
MTDNPAHESLSNTPVEKLTYEQAFAELEQIVAILESEERPLNEALAFYERGKSLARYCTGLLEQADLKVQQISGDELTSFNPQE